MSAIWWRVGGDSGREVGPNHTKNSSPLQSRRVQGLDRNVPSRVRKMSRKQSVACHRVSDQETKAERRRLTQRRNARRARRPETWKARGVAKYAAKCATTGVRPAAKNGLRPGGHTHPPRKCPQEEEKPASTPAYHPPLKQKKQKVRKPDNGEERERPEEGTTGFASVGCAAAGAGKTGGAMRGYAVRFLEDQVRAESKKLGGGI
ncbi:hypothetical protein B0H16DRAFT_1475604 [Mycena metata]|uniref:Uncharacterized protein n=1 Tax=Mycena metata TaxID=1033252 RepID=A0AAD7MIJ3_9AGAR|nr:hypothetical protein B0H16DRAFT_1475604 [Mycena metata]